jgi:hypothetical protein
MSCAGSVRTIEAGVGEHREIAAHEAVHEILGEGHTVGLPLIEALGRVFEECAEEIEGRRSTSRAWGDKAGYAGERPAEVDGVEAKARDVELRPELTGRPDVADGLVQQNEAR